MYKDVCKRILAVAVVICMVVTLVEWPTPIKAQEAPSYHIYQYAGTESAGFADADTASAVFMTGQNAAGGAEIFAGVSVDVHMENDAEAENTKAVVKLYTSPTPGNPESGYFVASSEIYGLTEGTNHISFDAASPKLMRGECFSIVLTLEGEGLSFYTDAYSDVQRTFTKQADGTWQDRGESGQAVALRAVTYDERMVEPQNTSLVDRIARALSADTTGDGLAGEEGGAGEPVSDDTLTDESSGNGSDDTSIDGTSGSVSDDTSTDESSGSVSDDTSTDGTTESVSNDTSTDGTTGSVSNDTSTDGTTGSGTDNTLTDGTAGSGTDDTLNAGNGEVAGDTLTDKTESTDAITDITGETPTNGVPENPPIDTLADPADTVELTLVPSDLILGIGESKDLVVQAKPENTVLTGYTWSVDKPDIVDIVQNGNNTATVTAKALGDAVVSVTVTYGASESKTLTCSVKVNENIANFRIEPEELAKCTYNGEEQKPSIEVWSGDKKLTQDSDYSVTYVNNINATLDGTTAKVIVSGTGGTYSGQAVKDFFIDPMTLAAENVKPEEMLAGDMTSVDAVAAKIKVFGAKNAELVKDTDYTLEFKDAEPTALGKHTAVITGKGNYTGVVETEYLIKTQVSNFEIVVLGNLEDFVYNRQEIRPAVEVYEKNGEERGEKIAPENYDVTYENNINAALKDAANPPKVIVTGKGEYYGTAEATFEIIQKDLANAINTKIPVVIPDKLPVAAGQTDPSIDAIPEFKVTHNGGELVKDTDYEITVVYPNGGDSTNSKEATLTLRGIGNYRGTAQRTYQIGLDIQAAIDSVTVENADNAIYSGAEIRPKVTVNPKSGTLTEGTDYIVEYENNVNAGTAQIYVRGIGSYGGVYIDSAITPACSAAFEIKPFEVDKLTYTYDKTVVYSPNKEEMKPSVTVSYNGQPLVEGEDYTLTLPPDSDLAVGKTTAVTVEGKGNFGGTPYQLPYEIKPCQLANKTGSTRPIVLSIKRQHTYTGKEVNPEIALKYVDGAGKEYPLAENTDFIIEPYEKVKAGTWQVKINGNGNYGGYIIDTITISGISIANVEFEIPGKYDAPYSGKYQAFKKYTGKEIRFDNIAVTYDGKPLVKDVDYEISYNNNVNMSKLGSTATFTIQGKEGGNYFGSATYPFLIYKELEAGWVSGIKDQTYTGEPINLPITVQEGILGNKLVEGVDYQVLYGGDNENVTPAGTPTAVTVKAMENLPTQNGCYYGKVEDTFHITPLDLQKISNLTYTVQDKTYEGVPVTLNPQDVQIKYPKPSGIGFKELVGGKDFTIGNVYNKNDGITDADNLASTTVNGEGNFTGWMNIEFAIVGKTIADADVTLADADKEKKYTGEEICPKPIVTDAGKTLTEGVHYKLSWKNNINAGDAAVIVEGIGNYSGTKNAAFKILPLDISTAADGTAAVTGVEASYTFTGADIEPNPTVKFTGTAAATPLTLVKGTDYTVTYSNNRNQTNGVAGAVVTIVGKGNYTGTLELKFEITKKVISDADVKIADIPPQPFDGLMVTPPVTITCGGYTLKDGEDYTLSYKNNTALGTNAKVIITGTGNGAGTGNYTGTVEKTFSITQSITSTDIIVICDDAGKSFPYTGKAVEPALTVMNQAGNVNLVRGTDYEIDYYNSTTGKDTDNVNVGQISLVIRGIGTYAGERAPITYHIIPKDIKDADVIATLSEKNIVYTGSPITPVPTASYNGMTLKAGTDYSVVYGNNTNAGTAIVTLIANGGNYIGSKQVPFTIAPKSIGAGNAFAAGFEMDRLPAEGYTGNPICPTPTVYWNTDTGRKPLVYGEDADYTLDYKNNTQIGIASIIISGTGNYTGSVTQTFEIKGGLDGAVITLAGVTDGQIRYEAGTKQSDGSYLVAPLPTVTLNGKTLKKGTDYTVSYENNDFVGAAKVLITGAGNYGGTISETFTILGDMTKAVVAPIDRQTYTGEVIEPNPAVTYYGRVLKDGTDYIRSYANNIEIGMDATLTVSGNGNFTGYQNVKFRIDPADGKFAVAEIPAQLYCGKQITPEVTVTFGGNVLVKDKDYTVTYGTNRDAGTGTATITGKDSYEDIESVVKSFVINPLDVNDLVLTDPANDDPVFTGIAPKEYTGATIVPTIKLTSELGGYTLTANDYTIACMEGYENIEVGQGAVVITGKGRNVYGTRNEKFTITQKDINNKPVTVTVAGSSSYVYSGTQICPEVTVKNGTVALKKDVDYFVDYGENISAGATAGTVIIQGNGNYMGSRTVNFKIGQLGVTSASIKVAPIPDQNYTGSAVTPPVTVTHTTADGNEYVLVENVDYTLTHQANTAAGTTARAVIQGKGNYMGNKTVTFKIIGHSIAAEDVTAVEIPNQAYTGKALTPPVTLTHGDYTLVRGKDYNLAYANNTELGTATVTITGIRNYTGTRTVEFKIVASDISTADVSILTKTPWIYTGAEIKPTEVTVKIGGTVLVLGTEYTLEYKNNINAGTAVLVVSGAGEYGGTLEVPFQIERKDITEKEVVLSGFKENVAYTGEEVKQNITLTYGENTLEENKDYIVQYSGNTAIGTATMLITGSGNYTGSLEKTFEISEKQIFDENLIVKDLSSTYTYTGEAITPKPILSINDVILTEGTDYTITYENNINAGVAKMTIEGTGNYAGTREETFNILRKSIQLGTFSSIGTQLYTGKEIRPAVSVSDGRALTMGTDYSLIYENNRNAGTATAVVAGMKNYTAIKTLRFDIRPGDASGLAVTGYSSAAISLGWNAGGVVTGYEVYRAGTDGKYQKIARVRGTAYTDKQLTAGTKYTYKVRAYLVTENETYYSAFSSVVNGNL